LQIREYETLSNNLQNNINKLSPYTCF